MRRQNASTIWTHRCIFIIVALSCLCVAAADTEYKISSKFDSGSASLARSFHDIKQTIPHKALPQNATDIKDTDKWAMDYVSGLLRVVGTGFAIALLSLLIGVLYGVFKLIRLCCGCCCKSKRDPNEESSEYDEKKPSLKQWIPTGVYAFCWVFMLTGMILGILNNPRFSDSVNELAGYVLDVQNNTLNLGDGILNNLNTIIASVPASLDNITDQVSGVNGVADQTVLLGKNVNATSQQVSDITAKVGAINAGNSSALASLNNDLAGINNSSAQTIGKIGDLTTELSTNLRKTVNETLGSLDDKVDTLDDTVDQIRSQANEVMNKAKNFTKDTTKYINDGKGYDESRGKAVTALFSLVIVVSVAIVAGYFLHMKVIFNVVAAFGFTFCFFLWFSGSIHFVLGMALNDACPIMDNVVQGMLQSNNASSGDGGYILLGCLFGSRTVLQSMNLAAEYNFSSVFDNQAAFDDFKNFQPDFVTMDSYFTQLNKLSSYNLSAIADNITVENFGWNDTKMYDRLDSLNAATSPDVFSISNYTACIPNNYGVANQTVSSRKDALAVAVNASQTAHNATDKAQQQLRDAHNDMLALNSNYTVLNGTYTGIKSQVNDLQTKNITNCISILNGLKNSVYAFLESGNCSFVGDTYRNILQSLCGTMQPAIDVLTVAQFLTGIALIPMTIVAELMGFRIKKFSRVVPCGGDVDEESGQSGGKRCEYAVALSDSVASPTTSPAMRGGITATIADSGPGSAANTPDMQRRIIGKSGEYSV